MYTNKASEDARNQRPGLVKSWVDDAKVENAEAMKAFMLARMLEWVTAKSDIPDLFDTYVKTVSGLEACRSTEFATLRHPEAAVFCQQVRDRCGHVPPTNSWQPADAMCMDSEFDAFLDKLLYDSKENDGFWSNNNN